MTCDTCDELWAAIVAHPDVVEIRPGEVKLPLIRNRDTSLTSALAAMHGHKEEHRWERGQ